MLLWQDIILKLWQPVKLVAKAAKIALHGITKAKFMAVAMAKPIRIPIIIPTNPPI